MLLLSPENIPFDLNSVPDEIIDNVCYGVMSVTPGNRDFYWHQLILLENFSAPAMNINVGGHQLLLPIMESPHSWVIAIADPMLAEIELLLIDEENCRGFQAFVYNPLSSFVPKYMNIEIGETYGSMNWSLPKLSTGQLLCIPLTQEPKSPCIFIGAQNCLKNFDIMDIADIL